MRLRIAVSINPAGFSNPDIVGATLEVSLPELANFSAGEDLSSDDVEAIRNRVEAGMEDVRGRINRDLSLLGNLARERAAAKTAPVAATSELD